MHAEDQRGLICQLAEDVEESAEDMRIIDVGGAVQRE
jgi:hypothetical protein